MIRLVGSIASFALILLLTSPALAQGQVQGVAGFSRARPILRTASEAPTATIRQLRFSQDVQTPRLYSAGDDKLVRSWSLVTGSGGAVQLEPGPTMPWPIYRAVRGVIYALDVQTFPGGDVLAFGGVGAKTSWVSLVPADEPHKAELHVDFRVARRDNIVNAVSIHPTGKQMAVGHERSALVLVWNLQQPAQERKAATLNTGLASVWHVAYNPRGDLLAIGGFDTAGAWQVQVWDSAGQMKEKQPVAAFVTGLCWGNDTVWVASTTGGIALRGEQAAHKVGDVRAITAPRGSVPYLVALYDSNANQCQPALWNGRGAPTPLAGGAFIGRDVALDISPDGRFIAAAGSVLDGSGLPIYAIRLWDGATQKPLAQFPDANRRGTAGAPIANVGVVPGPATDGGGQAPYRIGFTWGPTPGRNLPPLKFQFNRINRAVTPLPEPRGGGTLPRYFIDARNRTFLAVPGSETNEPWGALPVWGNRRPSCYAVNARETLLALGYEDGIVVCDLRRLKVKDFNRLTADDLNVDKSILRSFYGHEGHVTCLSFAPDDSLLLSGSKDGTICGWKIDDLAAGRSGKSELGVVFQQVPPRNFLTVVNNPPPGSLGAEAGFQRGQQVARVVVAGEELSNTQWTRYLNDPVPGKELGVTVVQNGRRIDLLTVVSHDPLWTLYPQQDHNWIVWTPEGHFDAPAEAIDRLAWHINLNIDETVPKEVTAGECLSLSGSDFKKLFHNPRPVDEALRDLVADKPQQHFVPPSLQLSVESGIATMTATRNGLEPIAELELWLNGMRIARRSGSSLQGGAQQTLTVKIDSRWLRSDGNQLVAVAAIEVPDSKGKKVLVYNRKRMRLPEPATAPENIARKLHYVGVGISSLDSPPGGLAPLSFPGHDAVELATVLRKSTTLQTGLFTTLADHEDCRPPTEENILAALRELPQHAGPDDLAVVFFAGHGVQTSRGFRIIAKDTKKEEDGKLSDVAINDLLSQLPCRTLLILDTCHAEGVVRKQSLQDWPGFGLGPMILAACDTDKESFEDYRLQIPGGLEGHGLFTAALLEGLLNGQRAETRIKASLPGRDRDGDGRLTIEEWCSYARDRTAMLSNLGISPFSRQGKESYTPQVLPSFSFLDHKSFVLAGDAAAGGQ